MDESLVVASACDIHLITFVPFVARGLPHHHDDCASLAPPPLGHAGLAESFGNLSLWGYSNDVRERLREHLPHRTSRSVVPDAVGTTTRFIADGQVWRQDGMFIDFWDLEVGLATMVHRLDDRDVSWAGLREELRSRQAKEFLLELVRPHVRDLVTTVGSGSSATPENVLFEDGEPLWVQTLILIETPEDAERDALDDVAQRLTSGGRKIKAPRLPEECIAVRLGEEACVVSAGTGVEAGRPVFTVIAAQTAVWAAAIELDGFVGALLREGGLEARRSSLEELDDRSRRLLETFERVQQFRADLDILPLHLDIRDKAVWHVTTDEWGLQEQLASLDNKLTAVEHVYAHLANGMSAKQVRYLNTVVLAVTILNFATFILAVWEFPRKEMFPINWGNAAVAAASVIASLLLFFVIWFHGQALGRAAGRRRS